MISVLTSGTLINKPATKTSRNGNPYVSCQIKAASGDDHFLVSLVAFDEHLCKALAALDKGDSVSVTGACKPSSWKGRDGEPCLGLNVIVSQLMTQYSLTKKRAAGRSEQPQYALPATSPLGSELSGFDGDGTGPF